MKLYKILNSLRKIYWFIFRPKTFGIKCLVENQNAQCLLIKTTYSGDYWTIPGGGCKRNEVFENAVIREVREEVGLTISKVRHIGSYTSNLEYKKDTVYLYTAETDQLQIIKNGREIADAKWFDRDSIPQNRSKSLKEILDRGASPVFR